MIIDSFIIKKDSYKDNNINELELKNVKAVGNNAFCNSNISNLVLNEGLEQINIYAFKDNNISSLVLPSSLKYIGLRAFYNNKIKEIFIPNSVKFIGYQAFDDNVEVIYDNKKFNSNLLMKIGMHNLIKLNDIINLVPEVNMDIFHKEVVINIPLDKEPIKSYVRNYKRYENIKSKFNNELEFDNKTLFKLCYLLGVFNLDKESYKGIESIIIDLYYNNSFGVFNNMLNDIKLYSFSINFCELFIKNYNNPNFIMILKKYYMDYDNINKVIRKFRENEISNLNTKYKKSDDNNEKEELLIQINKLKEKGKKIELEDILDYMNNHLYECRESCKELESVLLMLSCYLTKEQFDIIQNFYEKVKCSNIKSNLINYKDDNDDMSYEWLDNKDPINLVLGYICNCCAKYNSNGEDIMLQSMINPNIKTLIVRDCNNEIVAKTTVYFNKISNYLLFNTIEVKRIVSSNNYENMLDTILRGIDKQVELLNNEGYNIYDIRIGLKNNDLYDLLVDNFEVTKEMLDNYGYEGYGGDANDLEYGQVVIPAYNRKKGIK